MLRGVLLLVVNLIILAMVKSPEVVTLAALQGLTLDGKVLVVGVVLALQVGVAEGDIYILCLLVWL